MKRTIEDLKRYLLEALGVKLKLSPWKKRKKLSFFLVDTYDVYETVLLKQPCLLVIAKKDSDITPATIKNHLEQIHMKTNVMCIFVQVAITSYNRKRFIEHKIPFIIPGNQIYLPLLGVDLKEYYRSREMRKKKFRPATQAIIIYALLNQKGKVLTLSQLSGELGYSLMTMSRAFDELEGVGIGEITRKGKERLLFFKESKKELWKKAKPLLCTPVKKRVWAKGKKLKVHAGLSALAQESMLAPPSIPVYAVSLDEWKKFDLIELPDRDEAVFELEIWQYAPSLFAKKGCVDPFSLYLSLHEIEDERIEVALDELMGEIKW